MTDAARVRGRQPPSQLAGRVPQFLRAGDPVRDAEPGREWRTAAADSPERLRGLWRAAVTRSRDNVRRAVAEQGVDFPAWYTSRSGERPQLRRLLTDLIEEYARHVGHADLIREAVDGRVGEDPPVGFLF
ncbi:mycothiol transferase [Streptomyces sp. NBC_00820]|uniref:mycothiol transferase n=1 Tax=Streptomyces sp. NBC_00820 TaxID=2975842 RepID=UPI002ED04905